METIIPISIVSFFIISGCLYRQCKKRKLATDSEGYIAAPDGYIETSILPMHTKINNLSPINKDPTIFPVLNLS